MFIFQLPHFVNSDTCYAYVLGNMVTYETYIVINCASCLPIRDSSICPSYDIERNTQNDTYVAMEMRMYLFPKILK